MKKIGVLAAKNLGKNTLLFSNLSLIISVLSLLKNQMKNQEFTNNMKIFNLHLLIMNKNNDCHSFHPVQQFNRVNVERIK